MKYTKLFQILSVILGLATCGIHLTGDNLKELLEGAPPVIPHTVRTEFKCQHCHQIVHRPESSHLDRKNCRQCHVSLAANENHLMLDIEWDAFPGSWEAAEIPIPPQELRVVDTYIGAPPVIPHSTAWTKDCRECHTAGPDRSFASTHLDRQNCTQCHVSLAVMESRQFLEVDPMAFQVDWTSPVTATKQGRRNPAKKPTMIPHETEGLEDCLMCHSPEDTMSMATTHPERKNCAQCHIASASDEGRKFLTQTLTELK